MPLTIVLRPSTPTGDPGLPVWPLGHDIDLTVGFLNSSSSELALDDPRTSQKLLLQFYSHPQGEDTVLELNPPSIDVTGEITAPVSGRISLAAGESIEREVPLVKLCGDRCLIPGRFDVRIEYAEATSPVFHFGIEYTAGSVPLLLAIAIDERAGTWSRRQARALLNELPEPPAIEPTSATGEDPAIAVANYLRAFPRLSRTPVFTAFFERSRLTR